MDELTRQALENYFLAKWCLYAKAWGTNRVSWHEDWYYSVEQEKFFAPYEAQLSSGGDVDRSFINSGHASKRRPKSKLMRARHK